MTRRDRPSRALGAVLAGLVLLVVAGAPALAATTPSPSAAPAATGTPAPPTSGGAGQTSAPSPPAGGAATSPAAAVPAPSPSPSLHAVSAGGVLFVGGVRTTYHPSWDPFGGTLHVEMTVRNAYSQMVDASASIGAKNLLGMDLGGGSTIAVRGLQPGERRVVSADVTGVGQWTVLEAHATLTPPEQVVGVDLSSLDRARWVLVPPWCLVVLLVAVGIVVWVFRTYDLRLVAVAPRRAPAGKRPWSGGPPPGPAEAGR